MHPLSNNRISGSIPHETLGGWRSLEKLHLIDVLLTGSLPTEVGLTTMLQSLLILGAGLHGTIPTQIGFLTNLSRLDMRENKLSGTICSELGRLSNLSKLVVARQALLKKMTGAIRIEVCSHLITLVLAELLTLVKNYLMGDLTTEVGLLISLTRLDLYYLYLDGTLPSELGQLSLLSEFLSQRTILNPLIHFA